MARSRWKLVYFERSVWRKIKKIHKRKSLNIRPTIFSRKSSIPFLFSPFIVNVNKGKINTRLIISELHVGYKFGEFSFTRKPFYFPMRKSNQKNSLIKRR